jgi:uncharacterized damage-inducible protein DinB
MSADHYRRWFEYEKDAHAKTLASLEGVPEAQRAAPGYAQALTLGAHLVAARRLWLFRFGMLAEPPREFFPANVMLAGLRRDFEQMHALWSDYLARLDDRELARVFEYASLEGSRFRNTVEDILTQLFGHSWYHRGQIAQLVRGLGAEPAETDFVYWCREPI